MTGTELIKNMVEYCIPDGWELIGWKRYTDHPADWFLHIVLCKRSDGKEFVTWTANFQSNECSSGHYFRKEYLAARDFAKRGGKEAVLNQS